ncbi:ADP-ribose pyrophosphatase YjhB, NUDIX family [Proteiniborus ethanoligenes]|uniref:ADP-ribose pyrophosphatase YjhB, NUDIX family n=1 Tax=Proteiniborus ethanoligenes TaxID=415015 RepID=A0A1H3KMD5_9FIRM|nr:NUDIX domain-containing protein [Proteiniborus ethanoligenes]SDY53343.1 ADP-ribose pyrophosphatase YjhB, NUDIX family [Proteiniborus ethanoligenes]
MNFNKKAITAGAFVLYDYLFIFMVGPNKEGDLGVVRFGGHRENDETIIECLKRELKEEASITITLANSPVTYHIEEWDEEPKLIERDLEEDIYPIIIKGTQNGPLSVTYFAYSQEEPKPYFETHGILLLKLKDVELICKELITIDDFLKSEGKALFQKELRRDVILKPGVHLKWLSTLYKKNPDLIESFMTKSLEQV